MKKVINAKKRTKVCKEQKYNHNKKVKFIYRFQNYRILLEFKSNSKFFKFMIVNRSNPEEARKFLLQHALSEIEEPADFSKFYTRVFCVFAKYGLLMKTKEEMF